ncbi:hypothetical protein HDU83_007104 [Entophlyctis luteolus]|nr:hypothetical protein HDU82_005697 [Entophlyctis luteolus]KAJ3340391.1 hypothetical protein HDU83_007104 [Entophlyctis luteolus]KAJ3378827.1 hypothetical protein HDU84_007253 [Entophlyctis sp. JEL0112]
MLVDEALRTFAFVLALSQGVLAGAAQATVTASVATTATAVAIPAGPLSTTGKWIKGSDGRTVILRGLNLPGSGKVPDFMPIKDLSRLDVLADTFGANIARLQFYWEAYEPTEGNYNSTYLEYYAGVASALWSRGIYVNVDFHSDAYSRYLANGCGSGFPLWTIPSNVTVTQPKNDASCAGWGLKLQSDTTSKANILTAYNNFYASESYVQVKYLQMVEMVAARVSSIPGVVAFEPLNEPWGDEATQISKLYLAASTVIRNHVPKALIFLCPSFTTISNEVSSPATKLDPSLATTIGNVVYSPHYYDPLLMVFGIYIPLWPTSLTMHNIIVDVITTWNNGSGIPCHFGEFGGTGAMSDNSLITNYYNYLDEDLVGGTQWDYTPNWNNVTYDGWNNEDFSVVDQNNKPRAQTSDIRPHPRRIAGTPTGFTFSRSDKTLAISWTQDSATLGLATDVFFPSSLYSGSLTLEIVSGSVDASCVYSTTSQVVTCVAENVGTVSVILSW